MVAIDEKEAAQKALEVAGNIAKNYNAALCIVHLISGDDDADEQAGLDLLNRAKSAVDGASVETRLLRSELVYGVTGVAQTIAEAVKDWNADLVVVGTANRRGLDRFITGSVAEQLVTMIEPSILLVRSC